MVQIQHQLPSSLHRGRSNRLAQVKIAVSCKKSDFLD